MDGCDEGSLDGFDVSTWEGCVEDTLVGIVLVSALEGCGDGKEEGIDDNNDGAMDGTWEDVPAASWLSCDGSKEGGLLIIIEGGGALVGCAGPTSFGSLQQYQQTEPISSPGYLL